MGLKNKIKNILTEKNPRVLHKRTMMCKTLINTTPSLLCPNCLGGILFHDLGLKFLSPTINTMMLQTDFVKLVLDLPQYLQSQLVFYKHPEYSCPCAYLDDITIHFTHYTSEREAEQKWEERKLRMNPDNLFICLQERDGLSAADIRKLSEIKARGVLVFTANAYSDIPYALYIPKYSEQREVGNILSYSYITGKREYENYFDFVKWFNEADGAPYDIAPYRK